VRRARTLALCEQTLAAAFCALQVCNCDARAADCFATYAYPTSGRAVCSNGTGPGVINKVTNWFKQLG
jgi:hypothetical protein